MNYRKSIFIITLFAGFVLFFSKCINQPEPGNDPRGVVYAGAASCRQCHQAIYDSFLNTAHFKTTAAATAQNIKGHFNTGQNTFIYDSTIKVTAEKRDSGYYQVLYENGKEKNAYPFNILFGYRHAQTSLYWKNDLLFELPLSFYNSINAWATSPGFPADHPNFQRLVNTNCLDCHSSGIKINTTGLDESYDKQTLIYGIDCERCHGPALNHVNYHLANKDVKTPAYIVRNSSLTRNQKLDACAVCHSGNDNMKIQSRFLFKMGDTLGYFFMPRMGDNRTDFDVHGNQFRLMAKSKCFRGTSLTCGTCHDPHKNSSANIAMYSQKCMGCHKPETNNFCPESDRIGETIKNNCIDCHMPKEPSRSVVFYTQDGNLNNSYLLRTHKIAVYKDSIENIKPQAKGDHP